MAVRYKVKQKKKPRFDHVVCKPCWELKYCPYGFLVEYFPSIWDDEPVSLNEIKKIYKSWLAATLQGKLKDEKEVFQAIVKLQHLDPRRWKWISQFRTEELMCSVYGHICPVFFMAERGTETREGRKITRIIPRDVMLKVIRRDGHVCNVCQKNVPDNEIEFDHLIPTSRGGPTTAENLRVLCRACNRKKRDTLHELLA